MNKYEIMFIIDNDATTAVKKSLIEKIKTIFSTEGNKVTKEEIIGKQEMAYEINKKKLGYYVLLNVTAAPTTISEFERQCNIEKDIVRYIAVNLEK